MNGLPLVFIELKAVYRNIRRWLESIGIPLGKPKVEPAAEVRPGV